MLAIIVFLHFDLQRSEIACEMLWFKALQILAKMQQVVVLLFTFTVVQPILQYLNGITKKKRNRQGSRNSFSPCFFFLTQWKRALHFDKLRCWEWMKKGNKSSTIIKTTTLWVAIGWRKIIKKLAGKALDLSLLLLFNHHNQHQHQHQVSL